LIAALFALKEGLVSRALLKHRLGDDPMHVMHCPDCSHEYRLGFMTCPDCKTSLSAGHAPKADSSFDPDQAQARLATMSSSAFTTLPMNEAIRLRDQLLKQSVLAGLVPAGGGCDPSGCATNFTVMVPTEKLAGLNERYRAAFESYAAEQGMTLRNEPEDSCVCCGSPVSADDAECPDCGIALL
jgi:predicted amidophosphoribosyltransferase